MAFSIISPSLSLGRVLLRARSFAVPAIASPVILRRSFFTTPLVAENEKTTKKTKKAVAAETEKAKVGRPKKAVAAETEKAKVGRPKKNTITAKEAKEKVKVLKKHLKLPRSGRSLTPWMDFNGQYIIKHKTPGGSLADLVRAASQEWRTLSIEEKNKYGSTVEERAQAREIAKKYRKTSEYKRAAKVFGAKRAYNRPLAPYVTFYKANFDHSSPLSLPEQAKKLGEDWRALTLSQKDYWRKISVENFETSRLEAQKAQQ